MVPRAMQPGQFDLLDATWLGISGRVWLATAASVALVTPLLVAARGHAARRLRALAERTSTDLDDLAAALLERVRAWFLALVVLRAAALVLAVPDPWDRRVHLALGIGAAVQAALWAGAVVVYLVDRRFARAVCAAGPAPQVTPVAQSLLRFAGLVVVWTLALLVVLAALGVDITALVAGLGIGGVAVALAVQQVLGDVLASVSIAVDQPFAAGDVIGVGDQTGLVRRIGLRSTLLTGSDGEGLVVPNNDLLSSRIRNFSRMTERRVAFKVRVPHETAQAQVEALPGLLRGCVEGQGKVRFERANMAAIGESWLEFEVVYWVLDPDYGLFAATHEQVLFALLRALRAGGYHLAFPARAIHVVPAADAAA